MKYCSVHCVIVQYICVCPCMFSDVPMLGLEITKEFLFLERVLTIALATLSVLRRMVVAGDAVSLLKSLAVLSCIQ